ncbi:thiopeptide-type bacteriocin biosynthesis protein [Promicromonospora sp. NPDC090134]|uniref:thiopeptide-type bacteriocin biosynthesis protein n=1 Tax=Promicromonospora sp. NPDC090134 TaxID=3364408 RepID=UPI00380AB8B8
MSEPTRWSTLYVYLHRTPSAVDRFLLDVVGPEAAALVATGEATAWHFLRYWTGGPHLRVRLRDASAATVKDLADRLREACAAPCPPGDRVDLDPAAYGAVFTAADPEPWHADGDVVEAAYVPETDRYGGPEALALCEEQFGVSSDLALALLRATPAADTRRAVAVDLMLLALDALDLDPLTAVRAARGYFAGWDFTSESPSDGASARAAAEAVYWAAPARWDARPALVSAAASGPRSTHQVWSGSLRPLVARLRTLADDGALRNAPERIVWSLVHMMNNRLGLSVWDERFAAWLVSLATGAFPQRGAGFFDDGPTAADRTYLELSKYRSVAIRGEQLPHGAAAAPVRDARAGQGAGAAGAVARAVAPRSLAGALAGRRSAYGAYGALSRVDLEAWLDAALSGPAYPSAGALRAVEAHVLVAEVEGLPQGAYRFRPGGTGARHTSASARPDDGAAGPPPQDSMLEQVDGLDVSFPDLSPLVGPMADDPAASLEARVLPAAVVLVADIGRLREKYGLRALRLALLEAGHMAQNLGLCAADRGLASVHLGAFTDDAVNARLHLDGVDRCAVALLPVGRDGQTRSS